MNQDFQIRHGSKHYRPCNQYKHRFHRSHHRSLLGGRSVKINFTSMTGAGTTGGGGPRGGWALASGSASASAIAFGMGVAITVKIKAAKEAKILHV